MIWPITVTPLVAEEELHDDDRGVNGVYRIVADSEEEALDEFHWWVAIKNLDDFSIECGKGEEEE